MRTFIFSMIYFIYVLIGITIVSFGISALVPGDPAEIIMRIRHETPTQEQIEELRLELGIDKPLPLRYFHWIGRVLHGDLGRSWRNGEPVLNELVSRIPATLELALTSFCIILVFSTFTGVLFAVFRDGIIDHGGRLLSILAMSVPNYWLGFLLVYIFSIKLGWLPVMGRGSAENVLLPAITLGLAATALQGRVLRTSLIEVFSQDYVRFAIGKGLRLQTVILRHCLKNALGPVVTLWGISLGNFLAGSAIVESVFSWPGLGRLVVEAILSRDIPILQGSVMIAAFFVAAANLGADVVQKILHPRLHSGMIKGMS